MILRTSSGTSSRSGPLRSGRMTSVNPARWAASTFCLTPPIGNTRPCSVTSPVMPTIERTGTARRRLTSAVVMVTPAEGPSLGTAPAGTCPGNPFPAKTAGPPPSAPPGVRAHVGERDFCRLLHDVAQLAREGESLGTVGDAGLDEEDVAARSGHGQAGDHTVHAGPIGRFEEEVRPAEPTPHVVRFDDDRSLALARRELGGHLA